MNIDLDIYFPTILAWSANREQEILSTGKPLTPAQQLLAQESGVKHVDQIRLLKVKQVAFPQEPELVKIAGLLGMPTDNTAGRAIGYGVEIVDSAGDQDRLLRHEFRHVYQFESYGGLESFLQIYLRSIVEYGYLNSPWEQDARRAEHTAANDHNFLEDK